MTVQTISELWGWRPPAEWELKFIESSVGGGQRKDSRSRMITGILCLMFAFFILCGLGTLTLKGQASMAMLVLFGIIALLAVVGGVSLLTRSGENQAVPADVRLAGCQVLDAFCIRTDHRVDGNSISRIRVRDKVGQECAQWLNAPRSLARSFDAQAQREQVPVPVFPVLIAAWEGQYRVLPPVGPR